MPRRGIVKIEFFKTMFSGYPIQKSYPQKVPNPPNYSRRKLFEIQDSFGVRNTVFQKETPEELQRIEEHQS